MAQDRTHAHESVRARAASRPLAYRVLVLGAFALLVAMLLVLGALDVTGAGAEQGLAEEPLALGLGRETSPVTSSPLDVRGNIQRLLDASGGEGQGKVSPSPKARANVEASTRETLLEPAKRLREPLSRESMVVLEAVDLGDEATALAAAKVGILDPQGKLKRKKVDTSGPEWLVGQASGYDVASSSILTRTGRAFNDDCVTVAVPEGLEDLLGLPVEIVYEDMVVVATVTDTGGFAKYGRVLDLGGGVFKAFGFPTTMEWGVREVHYRYLTDDVLSEQSGDSGSLGSSGGLGSPGSSGGLGGSGMLFAR